MTRWSRRRFLGATAAACVGCSPGNDDGGVTAGTAVPAQRDEPLPTLPAFDVEVDVGPLDEVVERLASDGALYVPIARAWVVPVPADLDPGAYDESLHAGLRAGFAGLHQKCPHLGCRVPHCSSSGWFECPCHGTRFDALGEHRSGPAPRGMDHFVVRIDDGIVSIDTGRVVTGVPLGTATVVAEPAGPHCVEPNDP